MYDPKNATVDAIQKQATYVQSSVVNTLELASAVEEHVGPIVTEQQSVKAQLEALKDHIARHGAHLAHLDGTTI